MAESQERPDYSLAALGLLVYEQRLARLLNSRADVERRFRHHLSPDEISQVIHFANERLANDNRDPLK